MTNTRFLVTVLATVLALLSIPRIGMGDATVHVASRSGGAVADLRLSLHESVQPFLRGGALVEEPEVSITLAGRPVQSFNDSVFKGVVGAGVSFFVTPQHEIRTSYEYRPQWGSIPGDLSSERNVPNLGIGYHFSF